MTTIDRILVVIDPTTEQQPAVAKAARIAKACGARLDLLVCDYEPALAPDPYFTGDPLRQLREKLIDERKALAERHASKLRGEGLSVETSASWRNPLHAGIVERVQETAPSLVVKDTHYHSVVRRTLFTNTDWNLLHSCPAPLLLVKPTQWHESLQLLAALDPGHAGDKPAALDQQILAFASLLEARLGATVHAAHAFSAAALIAALTPMGSVPVPGGINTVEIVDSERQRLREALARLTGASKVAPSRVHFEDGSAIEVLPKLAGALGTDIVLMGAISRSRIHERFIGSTAERVLDHLPCDVLVLRAQTPRT